MRPLLLTVVAAVGLAWSAAILHARLRLDPFPHARHAAPGTLVATPIDPGAVTTTEPRRGVVDYIVALPGEVIDADRVELRFRAALDGARVEAVGAGPRTHATLLRQRVGGDTVVVPLPRGRVDAVEVRVHRNRRAPPIVRDARVLIAVTGPAARPPPAASPRSPH
jgi:hypothetical protein